MDADSAVTTILAQVLSLGLLSLLGAAASKLFRLDLPLTCVLVGLGVGMSLAPLGLDIGIRATNIDEIVFLVIMPILVLAAAWHLNLKLLWEVGAPVFLLATIGIVAATAASSALIYWGIGHPAGFPWIAAALTAAILVSTDPTSIVAKIREHHYSQSLAVLFEGEGLFNDAGAVVLFSVALSIALGGMGAADGSSAVLSFATILVGGAAVGLAVGLLAAGVIAMTRHAQIIVLTIVFAALGGSYLAEVLLDVSGIMAVLVSTLICRWIVLRIEASRTIEDTMPTLDWLELILTALLFVIMGLTITLDMFSERWLAMLIAIPAALIGRLAAVGVCALLALPARKTITAPWFALLVWGGARGVIPVALVLSLPTELDYWWTIQSMVFGVVLFGTAIQAPTSAWLVGRLAARV